jgi:hypothetical protein
MPQRNNFPGIAPAQASDINCLPVSDVWNETVVRWRLTVSSHDNLPNLVGGYDAIVLLCGLSPHKSI